jgi:hypothetical protein
LPESFRHGYSEATNGTDLKPLDAELGE